MGECEGKDTRSVESEWFEEPAAEAKALRKVEPAWSETSRELDGPGEAFFASLGVADFRVGF